MKKSAYLPVFELTRGQIVESVHFGAVSVVDCAGNLIASYGDPWVVTYLRSTAKPLQVIPFLEHGGREKFDLTSREVALICASHAGTDEHMEVLQTLQSKVGVQEADLLCGSHPIRDKPTREAMRARGEEPTPNQHNCSGKHTGMLAYARLMGCSGVDRDLPYVRLDHPIQKDILNTVAEMCGMSSAEINVGVDGCSAPNFALPLRNAALAFARLCDPADMDGDRATACRVTTNAMVTNPYMIGGPNSFDTHLMEATSGRIVSKGGAEAYLGMGLMPGALGKDSPAIGIAIKISDGDQRNRVKPSVALEVLRQLGGITEEEISSLQDFGPVSQLTNWRELEVGLAKPNFKLVWEA